MPSIQSKGLFGGMLVAGCLLFPHHDLTSAYFGMLRLGRASSVVFKKLKAPASPRPFFSISTTRWLLRRALSSMTESQNDLYDYTSGRWV